MALTSVGDPRDPSTWSNAPKNIVDAFASLGTPLATFGVRQTRGQRMRSFLEYEGRRIRWGGGATPAYMRDRLTSNARSDYLLASRAHHELSRRVLNEAAKLGVGEVIHVGNAQTVPLDGQLRNHLVCDTTWRTMVDCLADPARFPRKLVDAVDDLEHRRFKQVATFLPLSRAVAEDLIEIYGVDRDRVAPIATGRGHMAPNPSRGKDFSRKQVLLAAKLRFDEKGGWLLLEAMRHVYDSDPEVHLTIVGGPPGADAIPHQPNVTVRGYVSSRELESLFHSASLFAMPALYEPWGLVYVEALASQTPILGLRRNAFPEISRDGEFGVIVDRPDAAEIAEAIVTATSDPPRLERMAKAGQAHCLQTYTWRNTAEAIARAIKG